jgi:peptidoglycan/LPS O-acetylase OafA/YrhL
MAATSSPDGSGNAAHTATDAVAHTATAAGTIPALDGLRALAVLTVFLSHSGLEHVIPGGLGVTLFFVISGYLITTLMRVEHQASGRIDFARFYLRRALRLLPPLFIVTTLAGLLGATGLINGTFTGLGLAAALSYFGNYFLIAHDFKGMPGGLGVVWTLAIEEHYYLLFPPLALLLLGVGRRAVTLATLGGLCAAVLAWRCWLQAHGASVDYLTMATDTRIDAILVGSALALLNNPWLDPQSAPAHAPASDAAPGLPAWAQAALCAAVLLFTLADRDEPFRATWRYTLQSLAMAGLIHVVVTQARQRAVAWLDTPVLVYLGTISYTVYLVHHIVLLGLARHWPQLGWFWLTLVGALLTLAVAEPMRRWVELPCARLRRRLHPAAPAAAPSGAAPSGAAPVAAQARRAAVWP